MFSNDTTHRGHARRVLAEFAATVRRAVGLDGATDHTGASGTQTPTKRTESTTTPDANSDLRTDGGSRTRSELAADTGLAPDEYVLQLLENRGGRLRQSDIGDLTGLSASTTSRLLSEMEADGQIKRVSLGREKVVCLPTHTPQAGQPGSQATP